MERNVSFLQQPLRFGLIGGSAALGISAIGMVALFSARSLIVDLITLGHLMLFLAPAAAGYLAAERVGEGRVLRSIISGMVAGLVSAVPLVGLVALNQVLILRQFLANVSPTLISLLTFGQENVAVGALLLVGAMGAVGLAAAVVRELPDHYRNPLVTALLWTLGIGLFSEILSSRVRAWFGQGTAQLMFARASLRLLASLAIFLIAYTASYVLYRRKIDKGEISVAETGRGHDGTIRWKRVAAVSLILLLLPILLGTYLSEVVDNIGIYVLMGLGLNIVVGFAGLLDLGYVAFFAIGAYVMAILTSQGALGLGLTFWAALPVAVLAAVLAGILLGIPVLRMRGDYLAIVTLGFGEIIRILALSDLLKPYIGGAQGVLQIPKPEFFGVRLVQPTQIYYIILAGCALAVFVSWRLSESRLGRQWKAMREDEDVAEAMGIRLVTTKLLAFGIGAGFSGLAGAIFAPKLTSIFPHSFNLLISINVLSLIIVGGIGSLPGVVVGALILVGLPELLREFNEYRLLMYGALLIVMMIKKPEGFWPSQVRRQELHAHEEEFPAAVEEDTRVEGVRIS